MAQLLQSLLDENSRRLEIDPIIAADVECSRSARAKTSRPKRLTSVPGALIVLKTPHETQGASLD
jgi:hypothetical protein